MYTSGSTGLPKGVTVPHAGIVRLVCKAGYVKLSTNTRSLQLTSITFDLSVFEIWGPLLNGGTCILYPGPEPQYSKLQHIIRSESVNTMLLSASVFNSIVDTSPAILKGIRQLVIGAEALSSAHVKKALRALPEMTIINGYGPTEASALAICHTVSRNQTAKKSVPIGSPINHSIAYILDTKGRLLPTGVPGELHLGGIGLAIGYFRNRKQTEERFISKPFGRKSDTNLFRTGDRVFLNAEGNFDYIERMDDQVKIRGHRIEPGEIRSQIRNLKGCSDCFVTAQKNDRKETELVAYVVLDKGGKPDQAHFNQTLGKKLPAYMVPPHFVFIESLPLNSNGKVDRNALLRQELLIKPQTSKRAEKRSSSEEAIWRIWTGLLKRQPYSLDADFFESGGNSLLATSLIFKIQSKFSIRLPFTKFDRHTTVRSLANWVETEEKSEKQNNSPEPLILRRSKTGGAKPLGLKWRTFCIPDIVDPDNVQSLLIKRAIILEGNLRPKLLLEAMVQVINTNERLRTHAVILNQRLYEIIDSSTQLTFPLKDLSKMGEQKALKIAMAIFRKESLVQLNMRYAPQLRVQLLKISKRKYFLSFVIQHAVADGYSVEMFYKQTSQAYNELISKKKVSLKPPKFSYQEFETQLENWLENGNAQRIKRFWKRELRNIKSIPYPFLAKKLPERINWNRLDHYQFLPQWREQILSFCNTNQITTFVFFTTLVKLLIARYSGELDSYITSAVNGRTGHQQEAIFGDFACTILLRTKLKTGNTFLAHAKAEATKLYSCLDHKYISANGIDSPHKKQVDHANSPFGQLQVIEGADTGDSLQLKGVKSKFPMTTKTGALARLGFVIRESQDQLQITFAYAPMIFAAHSIDRLKQNFQEFTKIIIANPCIRLDELPDLTKQSAFKKPVSKAESMKVIMKAI